MSQTPSTNVGFARPAFNDPRWDIGVEALFDTLDDALAGWVRYGYINPPAADLANNQFSVPGDVTAYFPVGRKVRAHLSASYPVVTVASSSFAAATNLTTVNTNETTLDGTLTDVWASAFDVLYASASTFTVAGDKSAVFTVGLALKIQLAAGTVYGRVIGSSYNGGTGLTTVTVAGATLTSPIYVLWVSLLRPWSAADVNLPAELQGRERGYIFGLTLANNGGNPTTQIDIAAGECASDDATAAARVLLNPGAMTKDLSAAWAAGTGNGGRVEALADGTWHVYAFRRQGGAEDYCFSTSLSPALPDSGTAKRRIGSILRASGAIVAFTQTGDYFRRAASILDVNSSNPGTNAVDRTLSVPLGIPVDALMTVTLATDTGGSPTLYLSDKAATDEASSAAGAPLGQAIAMAPSSGFGFAAWGGTIRTNTSGVIRSRVNYSSAGVVVRIATLGWVDRRGRDS
jgi:hypothetical protein